MLALEAPSDPLRELTSGYLIYIQIYEMKDIRLHVEMGIEYNR